MPPDPHPQEPRVSAISFWLGALGLFALAMAWEALAVEPAAQWRHSGPVFFLTRDFAAQFLRYPGGLLDYAAVFLLQLNVLNWLGAAVFALTGIILFLATAALFRKAGTPLASALATLPALSFWILTTRIEPTALASALGVTLSVVGARSLASLSNGVIRGLASWSWAGLLCAIAGLGPCVLFIVLSAVMERRIFKEWRGTLFRILPLVLIPVIIHAFPDIPAHKRLIPWTGGPAPGFVGALYASPVIGCVAASLMPRRACMTSWKLECGGVLLLCAMGGVVLCQSLDCQQRAVARMDYFLDHKDYDRALAAAREIHSLDYPSEARLHLALYHAGRLGDDLFTYTNQVHWQLFAGMTLGLEGCRPQIRPMLELGQINEAEHMAHEAYEWAGDRADILKALVEINVLKDRPAAARVFLNVLRAMPFQGPWAEEALRSLDKDPKMPFDRDLETCAANAVRSDLAYNKMPTELILRQALQANPRNAMAVEYSMADCLMTGDLDKFPAKFAQWDALGCTTIPRHYEEAILLCQGLRKTRIDLKGRAIRDKTRQRFDAFARAVAQGNRASAESRETLKREFSGTFWYYYYTLPDRKSPAGQAP